MYNVSVNQEKGLSAVDTRTVNLEKGSELGERRHRQQGKRSEAALLPAGTYQEVEVLKKRLRQCARQSFWFRGQQLGV